MPTNSSKHSVSSSKSASTVTEVESGLKHLTLTRDYFSRPMTGVWSWAFALLALRDWLTSNGHTIKRNMRSWCSELVTSLIYVCSYL